MSAEHVVMVRHRHSRLVEGFELPYRRIDLIGAVKETQLTVEVRRWQESAVKHSSCSYIWNHAFPHYE